MENRRRHPRSVEERRRIRRAMREDPRGKLSPAPLNVHPLPDPSNPPAGRFIPLPLKSRYPSIPCLGSTVGCFRLSETEPLSEIQSLDHPWGGFFGPGEMFINKLPFEVGGHFDESSFYLDFPEEEMKPDTYGSITTFLKQVRESKGYDVDCYPPSGLSSPFMPVDRDCIEPIYYQRRMLEPAKYAIRTINRSMGENYELVEIEKAVDTIIMYVYLTFTAKNGMDNVHTFQAILDVPFGAGPTRALMEWRFKPDLAATSGA